MNISENVQKIKKILQSKSIQIVAASKKQPIEKIKLAIDAGIQILGENYVQEAEEKYEQIQELKKHHPNIQLHLIGHLQSNKVSKAVRIFDMIQSVDSIKIANKIDNACGQFLEENQNDSTTKKSKKIMPILIEINIGEEENKTGCLPNDLHELITHISTLKHLHLQGFMTMAPYHEDPELSREYFKKTKQLFDKYKQTHNLTVLSMGMSHTYNIAIEEGATMVRIGTKIFGPRN